MYAVCPKCHHTHAPLNRSSALSVYPTQCVNRLAGNTASYICSTELLVLRNGQLRPIKTFLSASFLDHIARLLADPEIERLCDKACDDAMAALHAPPPSSVTNVFDADFIREFEGPVSGQLFVDRGRRMRLAFALQLDFFNPNGLRKRGNHDSVGLIGAALLNLPETIRYKPEYMHAELVTGPQEPSLEEINPYI
ncbi:hypothetical protein C8J57DRAFT_1076451, partial [Mycena rebaudengoi]